MAIDGDNLTFRELVAMANGPRKKFYLLKNFGKRLPITPLEARELGCDTLVEMLRKAGVR